MIVRYASRSIKDKQQQKKQINLGSALRNTIIILYFSDESTYTELIPDKRDDVPIILVTTD
jgi:hypothetical protein